MCVCVQPWTKGLTPPLLHRQGGNARLTDIAQRRRCQFVVKQCGTPHCVPAEFSPCCDSTFHVFGSWFFMILPQNLPSAAFVLQLGQLGRADRSLSRLDQQLVETPTSLSDSSPCRSIAFLPIETIALTEKPKFEVCPAQPSHSGAECDPLHRGAVLAWESNHPNAPPITGTSQEGTDTLTESTATLAAGPKNGFLKNTSDFNFQFRFRSHVNSLAGAYMTAKYSHACAAKYSQAG